MKFFTNLSIKLKVALILACLAIIMSALGGIFIYNNTYNMLLEQRKIAIKDIVVSAEDIVEKFYDDFKAGKMSERVAQESAKNVIRKIRYGSDNKDYLFIFDNSVITVLHAAKPSLEGKDLSGLKDVNGVYAIKGLVDAGGRGEGDFFTYHWASKHDPKLYVPKQSFSKRFKQWGWNIGTGVYIEEVGAAAKKEAIMTIVMIIAAISIFTAIIIAYLSIAVIGGISRNAEAVESVSKDVEENSKVLSDASSALAEANTEQASAVQETAASVEELTQILETNIGNAVKTAEVANNAKDSSNKVSESIGKLNESMSDILKGNEDIQKLVEVIESIAEKTKVMDEIVFQTKLLSFNASVEAERAGEHGRGFAVVAQEVGSLAEMSGKSAREIAVIVSESISKVQAITDDNHNKVISGNEQLKVTSEELGHVVVAIDEIDSNVRAIANAAEEQGTGLKQINQAIGEIDQAIQRNSELSNQTADISQDLLTHGSSLQDKIYDLRVILYGNN